MYYNAHHQLCDKCKNCPIEEVCGGGFLGHRYSSVNKFDNPSVYCKEIIKIVSHIQNRMIDSISDNTKTKKEVEKLSYKEIIELLYN